MIMYATDIADAVWSRTIGATTAAERLVALAGTTGTAAALLLLIGTGPTAGDALVDYSGLSSGTAAEHILEEVQSTSDVSGGAGHPGSAYVLPTGKRIKKRIDDNINDAVRELYEELTQTATQQIKKQAAKIVRPHIVVGAKQETIPVSSNIDWKSLERDADRVTALLKLWQEQIDLLELAEEEEEMLLLIMAA